MTRTEQTSWQMPIHKSVLSVANNPHACRRHVAWQTAAQLKNFIASYAADRGVSGLAVIETQVF